MGLLLLLLGIFSIIGCVTGIDIPQNNTINNSSFIKACEAECRRCSVGAVGRGRCLSQCPTYKGVGNPCKSPKKLNEITIGCAVGVLLCIMVGVGALLCVRVRHKRRDSLPKHSARALKNFHKDLDKLRPHAYTFLGILNNVRRQVREMHRAGNTDAAVICLRSISDLSKILMLLNRKDVPIVPPDWPRLVSWAERLLERTSIPPPPPNPQVAQLIHFLQLPQKSSGSTFSSQSTPMSSMKPPIYDKAAPDSKIHHDYTLNQEWIQQWQAGNDQQNAEVHWQNRNHNSWIDDDFFLINLRPQDEIVTVL